MRLFKKKEEKIFGRILFFKQVIRSCKTETQLRNTIDWIVKVIKSEIQDVEMRQLIFMPILRESNFYLEQIVLNNRSDSIR